MLFCSCLSAHHLFMFKFIYVLKRFEIVTLRCIAKYIGPYVCEIFTIKTFFCFERNILRGRVDVFML